LIKSKLILRAFLVFCGPQKPFSCKLPAEHFFSRMWPSNQFEFETLYLNGRSESLQLIFVNKIFSQIFVLRSLLTISTLLYSFPNSKLVTTKNTTFIRIKRNALICHSKFIIIIFFQQELVISQNFSGHLVAHSDWPSPLKNKVPKVNCLTIIGQMFKRIIWSYLKPCLPGDFKWHLQATVT
jgi:hypothetical protein